MDWNDLFDKTRHAVRDTLKDGMDRTRETLEKRAEATGLKDGWDELKRSGVQKVVQSLAQRYPGFTLEAIRSGWMPVPLALIERQALPVIQTKFPQVTALKISGVGESALRVEVDTTALELAENRILATLSIAPFEIASTQMTVSVTCEGDPTVEGRHLVGTLAAIVIEKMLLNALRANPDDVRSRNGDGNVLTLRWPAIDVHLHNIRAAKDLLEFRAFGMTLTDIVVIGPVRVRESAIDLKVRPVGALKALFGS